MKPDYTAIEKFISEFECPEDFKCYKSGFDAVCKAKDVGALPPLLLCLEQKSQECGFLYLSDGLVCECPLRVYIVKELKK
jgi:hypothetical protein